MACASIICDAKALPQLCNKAGLYYGWVVLVVGTIGVCSSMPGQTVGISTFSGELMEALHLTRSQLSFSYLCGTISSSFVLPLAGKALDSWGPRVFTASAAFAMIGCMFYFSVCDVITEHATYALHHIHALKEIKPEYVSWTVAYCGFFAVRHFGQGWLTMGSRTMMASWWEAQRGRMMAYSGMGVAFMFGITPLFFERLIRSFGWRDALRGCLGGYLLFFAGLSALFYRRDPDDCDLAIDGGDSADEEQRKKKKEENERDAFSAKEALRCRSFWIYLLGMCAHAMITTGNTFHIAYAATMNGVSQQKAFSVFLPAAFISTAADVAGGFLQERVDMRWLLATQCSFLLIFIVGILHFDHEYGWWLMAIGQGVSGGMFAQLQGTAWPNLFGTKHLGEISGYTMAFVVGGSALGPYSFTLNGAGEGNKALFDRNLILIAAIPLVGLLLVPLAIKPEKSTEAIEEEYELVAIDDESIHGCDINKAEEGIATESG